MILNDDDTLGWNCHHCGNRGRAKMQQAEVRQFPVNTPMVRVQRDEDMTQALAYLSGRKISEGTAASYRCYQAKKFFTGSGREEVAVAFPTFFKGQEKSVKYRAVSDKMFTSAGAPPVLFGLQLHDMDNKTIIISEGEIDALSWYEAGIRNSFSVPAGANLNADEKKGYLWNSRHVLDAAERVVIAMDNDDPGQACAEELSRRIGRHKCWVINYPEECKDANDVLRKHGPEKLVELYNNATPWPVAGLYDTMHYSADVFSLISKGEDRGYSTGLQNLDEIFRMQLGKLVIVTGIPGSGKSELLDQIMVNTAESEGWKYALCSFENTPPDHIRKILEKRIRKPAVTMTPDEVDDGLVWVNDHFYFLRFDDGLACTIEDILEKARIAVLRYGIHGLVVDPYNYVQRDMTVTETQYVSDALTACRRFASSSGCTVYFVAHPAKLQRVSGDYPMPGGYDISGSAAWFAKADTGLTVGRGREEGFSIVQSWKQRDKGLGKVGVIALKYERSTGIFSDGDIPNILVDIDGEGYDDDSSSGSSQNWWAQV